MIYVAVHFKLLVTIEVLVYTVCILTETKQYSYDGV